jgi:hypothetical protein
MTNDNEAMLTPGAAAVRLGVSGSALRRLALSYVGVYGPLPEGAGGVRLWPVEAVERLAAARALMAAGRARSARDALEALEAGAQVSPTAALAVSRDTQLLEVIGRRLEGVERLEVEVEAMRAELAELRALPPVEAAAQVEGGVLVRLARRLEQLLRRLGAG